MPATRILYALPDARSLPQEGEAAAILGRDGIAVYPTDTFYGLGGNAFSAAAVDRIYELKERFRDRPLPIVVSGLEMAAAVAAVLPEAFRRLAAVFWPGPLSLVVPARPVLPAAMLGPGGTVAMRVPALPWLRGLLDRTGFPLTSTSANRSGASEIDAAAEARRLFEGRVDLMIDGGKTPGGAVSTIVDLSGPEPLLLRPGAVAWDRIRTVLDI
ncbi:MAG: L-threonylcarbamoyladenylate synthase [Acidobacteriota bacterium]|nr:L-threonylcarbamoyladenylate synthase [Acidobacteriota bacterium]